MTLKRTITLLTALFALGILCAGCSGDGPVAPAAIDEGGPVGGEKTMCDINGNVFNVYGQYAVGVEVAIYRKGMFDHDWVHLATRTTGQYGDFSFVTWLNDEDEIWCTSLGDSSVREWTGGAYLYFSLQEPRKVKDDPTEFADGDIPNP